MASVQTKSMRVLVVDDEPIVRESVAMMLRHLGHVVQTAGGGEQALDLVGSNDFDLALADFKMPGMNGFELAREMGKQKPEMPFILMTGCVLADKLPQEIRLLLPKPFSITRLREVLRDFAIPPCAGEPNTVKVVVAEAEGRFTIRVTIPTANCSIVAERHNVVNETARVLNSQRVEQRKLQLVAPEWIRTELERRGYAF
jgi:CheY-like chemotaxis protein